MTPPVSSCSSVRAMAWAHSGWLRVSYIEYDVPHYSTASNVKKGSRRISSKPPSSARADEASGVHRSALRRGGVASWPLGRVLITRTIKKSPASPETNGAQVTGANPGDAGYSTVTEIFHSCCTQCVSKNRRDMVATCKHSAKVRPNQEQEPRFHRAENCLEYFKAIHSWRAWEGVEFCKQGPHRPLVTSGPN
jgi:hypothetical protein